MSSGGFGTFHTTFNVIVDLHYISYNGHAIFSGIIAPSDFDQIEEMLVVFKLVCWKLMDTKTHFCNLIEIKLDIGIYDMLRFNAGTKRNMSKSLVTTLVDGYLSI